MNGTGVLTMCNFTFETRPYIFPRMENEKEKKKKKEESAKAVYAEICRGTSPRSLDPPTMLTTRMCGVRAYEHNAYSRV